MRRFILVFLVLFTSLTGAAIAQDKVVKGKVTQKDTGEALAFVNVVVKGTTKGTQTDMDGNYQISVPTGSNELVFTFIGMKNATVTIDNRSVIDVTMDPDAITMTDVVVTGYQIIEKRELTGAVSMVKGEDIQNLPVQSFDRALQGRTAGVLVQSANGAPGGAVQVRIRGTGSITAGNDPLYVVDGVQINARNDADFASGNPLGFLNPNDIENIEILKDAAAASIYGAQAANGVVLITTKKGKAGRTKFDFSYYRGSVSPIQKMDVLNTQEFINLKKEGLINSGQTPEAALKSTLSNLRLPATLTDAEIAALPTYDWQDAAFRQGVINNAELSASGGNEKTTFYFSGSYNKEDANVVGVDFQRLTGRLSVNHKVNDRFGIDASLNVSAIKQKGAFGSPSGGTWLGSPYFSSSLIIPINPIYNEDGTYNGLPTQGGLIGLLNQNVIANANYNRILSNTKQAVGNFGASYKIMDGLSVRYFAGIDYRTVKGFNYADPRTADGYSYDGYLEESLDENVNYNTFLTLNYVKKFGEHKITGLLGVEYRSDTQEYVYSAVSGFPTPQFFTANSASTNIGFGGLWTGFKRASAFGKLDYNFKNKYFASLVNRYDGSSRFGTDYKYGWFPAASVAWAVNEEAFLKDNEYISGLKTRLSYGTTGNDDIGNFSSLGLFGAGYNYNDLAGIGPIQLGSPALRWEKTTSYNAGVDMAFLDGRITSTVEYFVKNTSDLLLNRPLPGVSGFTSITDNIGKIQNKGWEFEISSTNLDMENGFVWATSFNFSKINNYVKKLNGDDQVLPGNQSVRVGEPLSTSFNYQYIGVNPATGRPMWYDKDNNITYRPIIADARVVGDGFAEIFGGLTNTFSYKGVELSFTFQYEFGRMAYNDQNAFLMENIARFNGLKEYYDRRWQKPGDVTDVPRALNTTAEVLGSSNLTGTRTYQDASYIRLKTTSLSYTLPKELLSKVKLANVRVYVQALNLLTFTKWEGYDPEFVALRTTGNAGVIPQSRKYTFGVQIGF